MGSKSWIQKNTCYGDFKGNKVQREYILGDLNPRYRGDWDVSNLTALSVLSASGTSRMGLTIQRTVLTMLRPFVVVLIGGALLSANAATMYGNDRSYTGIIGVFFLSASAATYKGTNINR